MNIQEFSHNAVVKFFAFWVFYIGVGIFAFALLALIANFVDPGPSAIGALPFFLIANFVGPIGFFILAAAGYLYAQVQPSKVGSTVTMVVSGIFTATGVWFLII